MSDQPLFEQALEDIADGRPVDWALLDSQASDAALREEIDCLRIIGDLDRLHRQTDDEGGSPVAESTDDLSGERRPASSSDELRFWGRFQLLAKVGEGSFGRVFRAWDSQLEREVALKILHGRAASERLKERLLQEGRALARIHDPHVVLVHGVESHEGRVALCMEFVHGRTLDDIAMCDGRFSVAEAVRIGRDICQALAAVHRSGFVHRDVKARNVMRDDHGGRIVLMDFGAGQETRLPDTLRTRDGAGTPLYMAPELFAGDDASPCSDVYSVGVLVFYLLTGEYPVEGQTLGELRAAHRTGRRRALRERRTDVPPALARIVDHALAARPSDRYPHAAALLQALEPLHRERVQEVRSGGWIGRALMRMGVGLCVVLAVALLLGSLMSQAFNHTLERGEFAQETWTDWLRWGVKSSVAPGFIFLMAWILSRCLILGRALLIGISDRFRRLEVACQQTMHRLSARFGLDDGSILASWVFLADIAALLAIWWHFAPLIDTVSTQIGDGEATTLALLSPAFASYQDSYRQTFTLLLLVSVMAWYGVLRLARRNAQPLRTDVVAAATAAVAVVLVSLQAPYRLLIHNEFDVVRWRDQTCYVLGSRAAETLLFCPNLPPPRHRVVSSSAADIQPLGRPRENVYTAFAAARAAP